MAEEKEHSGKKALFCASAASHIINFHNGYLESLQRMGFEVHAAAGINAFDNSGLGLIRAQKTFRLKFEKGKKFFLNIASAFGLAKIIRREKYDIISTHSMLAGFVGRLAVLLSRRKNIKVMHTCHGYLFDGGGFMPKPKILVEKFLAGCTDLLFVMNADDYKIAKKYKLCKRIEYTQGMGLSPEKLEAGADPRQYSIPPGKKYILCVGEFSKRKNQKTVILAFARFLRALPKATGGGYHLVFLGGGALLSECRRLCERLGITANVSFAGYVGDVAAFYKYCSHLVVSASRFEGLPFNIMEALHYNKPVLASNVKGHKDLIFDGFNGFLFDFGDSAALSALFLKAFEPNTYESLKSNAKLDEKYYFDNVKDKILNCYRDILR